MASANNTNADFYIKCAKSLILNLTSSKDRSLASAWLKRLAEDNSIEDQLRTNCLQLLLFVLQNGKLRRPFTQHPNNFDDIAELTTNNNLFEGKSGQSISNKPEGSSFTTELSGDLRTYAACQEIDKFGVHCYYALSNDPITTWNKFNKNLFAVKLPLNDDGNLFKDIPPEDSPVEELTEEEINDAELERKKKEFAVKLEKKARFEQQKLASVRPPLGVEMELPDERLHPSWGSNLLHVKNLD